AAATGDVHPQLQLLIALFLDQLAHLACGVVAEIQLASILFCHVGHRFLRGLPLCVRPVNVPIVLHPARCATGISPQRIQRYGSTAISSRPAFSLSPSIRFMFCTAWLAAPLLRLSITENTITVSLSGALCT